MTTETHEDEPTRHEATTAQAPSSGAARLSSGAARRLRRHLPWFACAGLGGLLALGVWSVRDDFRILHASDGLGPSCVQIAGRLPVPFLFDACDTGGGHAVRLLTGKVAVLTDLDERRQEAEDGRDPEDDVPEGSPSVEDSVPVPHIPEGAPRPQGFHTDDDGGLAAARAPIPDPRPSRQARDGMGI